MDDSRFDALAKSLVTSGSRRRMLRSFAGLSAAVGLSAALHDPAGAARRGFSGPRFPKPCSGETCNLVPSGCCDAGLTCCPGLGCVEKTEAFCCFDSECLTGHTCRGNFCCPANNEYCSGICPCLGGLACVAGVCV